MHRFYGELASWWPLVSPVEEYAEEAAEAAGLLASAAIPVREVLELGSGGGHNAVHLKTHFALTLVDLSEEMLAVSRRLNPECAHHQGDMRTLRLGRDFDAVFVHDAVDYMTTEDELRGRDRHGVRALPSRRCRRVHAGPHRRDIRAGQRPRRQRRADGRGVRYLEWTWDPDPDRRPGRSPSTRSCSATPTARCGPCTRPTAPACSPATPGCGCWPTPASRPNRSPNATPTTAHPGRCSSPTARP